MRGMIRDAKRPACYEGRVSKVRASGLLEVKVRALMGDLRTLPARGYQPRVVEGDDGLELLDAVRDDVVWLTEDEGGQFVVVTWEPA